MYAGYTATYPPSAAPQSRPSSSIVQFLEARFTAGEGTLEAYSPCRPVDQWEGEGRKTRRAIRAGVHFPDPEAPGDVPASLLARSLFPFVTVSPGVVDHSGPPKQPRRRCAALHSPLHKRPMRAFQKEKRASGVVRVGEWVHRHWIKVSPQPIPLGARDSCAQPAPRIIPSMSRRRGREEVEQKRVDTLASSMAAPWCANPRCEGRPCKVSEQKVRRQKWWRRRRRRRGRQSGLSARGVCAEALVTHSLHFSPVDWLACRGRDSAEIEGEVGQAAIVLTVRSSP